MRRKRPPMPPGWPKDAREGLAGWMVVGLSDPRYALGREFLMCQSCFEKFEEGQWYLRMDVADRVLVACCHAHMQQVIDQHTEEYFRKAPLTKEDIAAMF